MKGKGFTLIELLAVIVILAIIALIATPMILGVIETARKGAAESSALGYLDAIEKQIMMNQLDSNETEIADGTYNLPMEGISVKGELPSTGWVTIEGSKITDYEMTIIDYNVTYEAGEMVVSKGETEEVIEAESVSISGDSETITGKTIQLTATILPESTTDKTITWKSSNEEIATVTSSGQVSGISTGTVTITATTTNGKEITKEITISMPVCRRALAGTLHTEECTQTSDYCYAAGYVEGSEKGTTIEYGKLGEQGEALESGDALDCDVDGSGTYDEDERFYYVSDLESDSNYAVLIYYNNVSKDDNGLAQADNTANSLIAYYSSADENWHGPVTAITNLPTISDWSNVSLSNTSRTILNEEDGLTTNSGSNTIENPFSYEGYAARLLTAQEVETACNITVGLNITGELDGCNYLMENTKYSSSTMETLGYWLETPRATNATFAGIVYGNRRFVDNIPVSFADCYGARPAIEVLKSKISN